jgi:hypothetical protein
VTPKAGFDFVSATIVTEMKVIRPAPYALFPGREAGVVRDAAMASPPHDLACRELAPPPGFSG